MGLAVFSLLALALDLPEDFFTDKVWYYLQYLHTSIALLLLGDETSSDNANFSFPPQTDPVDDRVISIGAHTEYEPFTSIKHSTDVQPSYEVFTVLYQ